MLPELSGVQSLQRIQQALASRQVTAATAATTKEAVPVNGFNEALNRLTETQAESDRAIEQLIAGEDVDLHQVMLSVEKTDIAFRVALQLRNKLVQAYQEIMRIQA